MKKYIQRGLCELSEIAKTFSTVYVKVFRLFIYLIVWKHGSSGRIARQVARVYWESLCGFNSQCVNIVDNLSFLDKYKSWHEAVSDPKATCCKNGLNADIFFRVLEKRGKNRLLLLANAWKASGNDWLTSTKRQAWTEGKTLWGRVLVPSKW